MTVSRKAQPSDLTWTPNPEGEYNAEVAEYRGHTIEVYSDRTGEAWEYILDDDMCQASNGATRDDAKQEAMRDVDSIEDRKKK